jgi:hypothetical protein
MAIVQTAKCLRVTHHGVTTLNDRLRMPAKSKAQLKWAYWTASGKNPKTPASVGQEFVQATPKKQRSQLMQQIRSHLTKSGRLRGNR